jgi:hypothetical protein
MHINVGEQLINPEKLLAELKRLNTNLEKQ